MKRLLVGALFLVLPCFVFTAVAQAHSFRTGDNVNVGSGQTIQDTLFASGRTVEVASEVYGDVFCVGQNVTVSGTIHGDVICAGQTVTVTGTVDGDVRLAGQTVTVNGTVGGNATVASQSFSLSSSAKVNNDVSLASGDGTFNGTVGRDLAIGSEQVTIAGQVGRNVKGNTTNLTLAEGSHISGSVDYTSNNELNRANGALVDGTVTRTTPQKQDSQRDGGMFALGATWFLYWFFALLLIALILVLLIPSFIHRAASRAVTAPWKPLLVGFATSVLLPIFTVLLAMTFVGLPLAFVIGLSWLVIMILSGPFFGYYIGRLLMRTSTRPIVIMLVGSALLLVLYFIPVIGFLVMLAALWIGSGIILLEIADRTPRPAYSIATVTPSTSPVTKKVTSKKEDK